MEPRRARVVLATVVIAAGAIAIAAWLLLLPDIEGPPALRFPECQEHHDPVACERIAKRFHDECLGCHYTLSFQRAAPDLVGLLGRKRTFASGETLVADEAYIRRSIADHTDESEYIPGYAVLPDELEAASHGLTDRDIDLLATRVLRLEPHSTLAVVEITKEWSSADPRVKKLDQLLQTTRASFRDCYQGALETEPSIRGTFDVVFLGNSSRGFAGEIAETDVTNPIVVNCIKSVVERDSGVSGTPAAEQPIARYRIRMSANAVRAR